jgi:hypothetical protein
MVQTADHSKDSARTHADIKYIACSQAERSSRRHVVRVRYRGADKSLARPGRKQATATEDFDFHISYL